MRCAVVISALGVAANLSSCRDEALLLDEASGGGAGAGGVAGSGGSGSAPAMGQGGGGSGGGGGGPCDGDGATVGQGSLCVAQVCTALQNACDLKPLVVVDTAYPIAPRRSMVITYALSAWLPPRRVVSPPNAIS